MRRPPPVINGGGSSATVSGGLSVVAKRRPPESRPTIGNLWSANTKLAPNPLRGDRSARSARNTTFPPRGLRGICASRRRRATTAIQFPLRIPSSLAGLGRNTAAEGSRRVSPFLRSWEGDFSPTDGRTAEQSTAKTQRVTDNAVLHALRWSEMKGRAFANQELAERPLSGTTAVRSGVSACPMSARRSQRQPEAAKCP
jgi:hypothetical protein